MIQALYVHFIFANCIHAESILFSLQQALQFPHSRNRQSHSRFSLKIILRFCCHFLCRYLRFIMKADVAYNIEVNKTLRISLLPHLPFVIFYRLILRNPYRKTSFFPHSSRKPFLQSYTFMTDSYLC